MLTRATIAAAAVALTLASAAGPAAVAGEWNAWYQAAQPGATIVVPAGTYQSQVIQWRADMANRTPSGVEPSPQNCVTFVMGGDVTIQGVLEVRGSGVCIKGVRSQAEPFPNRAATYNLHVTGSVDTEANSVAQHPDHVVFEGIDATSFGAFNVDTVTFRKMDVGPATVSSGCGILQGPGFENKIGFGGGILYVPKHVTLDNMFIHNQNGDFGRVASDCHFGGLFVVTVDGLTIRNTVFERNVVYHIQVQNFSGPSPKNVLIENSSFACSADWIYNRTGDDCSGQRAVQLNTSAPGVTMTLRNNISANGPDGLFGCYTPCDRSGVVQSGTIERVDSVVAPDLNDPGNVPPPPPPPPPVPTADTQPPTVPQGLRLIGTTETSIGISWSPSSDNVAVIGYRLYRDGQMIAGNEQGPNYTFTGLACGTSYRLGVTAIDAAGNESVLAEAVVAAATTACAPPTGDTEPPSTPGNFRVTAGTRTTVALAWNASTDNIAVVGYRLYRAGTLLLTLSPASLSTTRGGLTCGSAYAYELEAFDAAGNKSGRAAVTATCGFHG